MELFSNFTYSLIGGWSGGLAVDVCGGGGSRVDMPDETLLRRSLLRALLALGGSLTAGAVGIVVLAPALAQLLGQTAAKAPATAKPAARRRTILLDPGHGGIDPGAIGLSGVHEEGPAPDDAR